MSKFYPIKVWHLDQEDFYTPDGNRPIIVSDGWFGGDVVYEPKTKKVYRVGLMEVKVENPEFIEKCEFKFREKELRYKININNIDAVEQAIKKGE